MVEQRAQYIQKRFGLTLEQQVERAVCEADRWDEMQRSADRGHVRYVLGCFAAEAAIWRSIAAETQAAIDARPTPPKEA